MTICVNRDDAKRDFGMLFLAARHARTHVVDEFVILDPCAGEKLSNPFHVLVRRAGTAMQQERLDPRVADDAA